MTALVTAWSVSAPAFAAQVTEVADAVDGEDPFDANLEVKFDMWRHSGLITRENFQPPENEPSGEPRLATVKELDFEKVRFRIRPRLEIGVFHDLAVFAEWPIVIWDQQSFRFADGTNADNSTLIRDAKVSPTLDGWPETEGAGNKSPKIQNGKFGYPGKPYNSWNLGKDGTFNGYRQGFDNPTFGLRFSPLNNERDDTAPSITLQADYTAPFFAFMDPTGDELDDTANPGPVADGAHRFHFSVAMSKRFLILDPYFVVEYGLPLAATSGGSLLGYQPRQTGGFTAGLEIVPFEDKERKQRFAVDLSANATYLSEGRDYTVASDLLREQTYADQCVRTGVNAGVSFRPFEYFYLSMTGSLAADTEHLLTIEDLGQDDKSEEDNKEVNLEKANEREPAYNPVIDTVGRRIGLEQSLYLGLLLQAAATF